MNGIYVYDDISIVYGCLWPFKLYRESYDLQDINPFENGLTPKSWVELSTMAQSPRSHHLERPDFQTRLRTCPNTSGVQLNHFFAWIYSNYGNN